MKQELGNPLHTVAYILCTFNWYSCWGDLIVWKLQHRLSFLAQKYAYVFEYAYVVYFLHNHVCHLEKTDYGVTINLLCIGTSVDQDIIF